MWALYSGRDAVRAHQAPSLQRDSGSQSQSQDQDSLEANPEDCEWLGSSAVSM